MGFLSKLFCHKKKCGNPCEIAELIYQAQTACDPDDRESAVDDLGDYDCVCHPEVMCALLNAMNDCDPEVRAEAADEIGDLIEDNACCCSPQVVAAMRYALGDCDNDVREAAEEVLELCGYCIVDSCCRSCNHCGACGKCGCNAMQNGAPETAPAAEDDMDVPETAPAPPEEPKAYFPSRPRYPRTSARANRLSNLFGLN
jgi:hypothetical protein